MKGIRGLEIIKGKIDLKVDSRLPQYKQREVIAAKMAGHTNPNTGEGCPRAYGLSDPYTREKKYKISGSTVCMTFQLGGGCTACWGNALREMYPKKG
jgi:hypothetical protein